MQNGDDDVKLAGEDLSSSNNNSSDNRGQFIEDLTTDASKCTMYAAPAMVISPYFSLSAIGACTFGKQFYRAIPEMYKSVAHVADLISGKSDPIDKAAELYIEHGEKESNNPASVWLLTHGSLASPKFPQGLKNSFWMKFRDTIVDSYANEVKKNQSGNCIPNSFNPNDTCFYGPEEKFESLRRENTQDVNTAYIYKPYDILNPKDEDQINSADDLLKSNLSPLTFTMRINSLKMQQAMDSRYSINNLDFQSNVGKHAQENDPVCEDGMIKPKGSYQPSESEAIRPIEQVGENIPDEPTTDDMLQNGVVEAIHDVTDISQDKVVGDENLLKQNRDEAESKASNNIEVESINFNLPENSNPKIEVTEEQERKLLDSNPTLPTKTQSSGEFTSGRNVGLNDGVGYVHKTDRGSNIGAGVGGSSSRGVDINFQVTIPCAIF